MRIRGYLMALIAGMMALGPSALADDLADAGRRVATNNQDSLVTVQITAKISITFQGQEQVQETKGESCGVIIDPSGLVMASLEQTDPTSFMDSIDMEGARVNCELTEVKYRLGDGTEIAAEIISRENESDLVFLRPKTKLDTPLAAIDVSKSSKAGLLDPIFIIYRLGIVSNRAINITLDRISAMPDKPSVYYLGGMAAAGCDTGAPVFAQDGTLVGFLLVHSAPVKTDNEDKVSKTTIILPAADIVEAVKKARETR